MEADVEGVEVEPSTTVAELKQRIEDIDGIPTSQLRLVFAGKQLHDSSTLEMASLRHGDTVHILLNLLGGTSYVCGDCGGQNFVNGDFWLGPIGLDAVATTGQQQLWPL